MKVTSLAAVLICSVFLFADESVAEPVTSEHIFNKDQRYYLDLRECDKGRHPIVISHLADISKSKEYMIPNTLHHDKEKGFYFTFDVENGTKGIVAQFCHPKNISAYFKKLKAESQE